MKICRIAYTLLALSAMVYLGVDLFYRVLSASLPQPSMVQATAVARPGPVSGKRPEPGTYTIITQRNLFGSKEETQAPPPMPEPEEEAPDMEALQPTSLNIALLGTVAGSPDNTRAVIEDRQRRAQALYRVGDEIQGAAIRKIVRGKVVLRVKDQDEVLVMEENPTPSRDRPHRQTAMAQTPADVSIDRTEIEESLKDVNSLLNQVRIRPHVVDGQPSGFMLSFVAKDSMFERLGLQRGDIVREINGSPIRTPEDAFSFYKILESGGHLSLNIERGGAATTINYTIQ